MGLWAECILVSVACELHDAVLHHCCLRKIPVMHSLVALG